jgi:hypothetical protein
MKKNKKEFQLKVMSIAVLLFIAILFAKLIQGIIYFLK